MICVCVCVQVWQWPAHWWMSLSRCVWATRRSLEAWGTANNSPPHSHPPVSDHTPRPPLASHHSRLSHQPRPPTPPNLPRPPSFRHLHQFRSGREAPMLVCRTGTYWRGAELSGRSAPVGVPFPLLLSGSPWLKMDKKKRGGTGEGGKEGQSRCWLHPLPSNDHFTFVDSSSLASRWPRPAARRDPRLVGFEKFTDCATLYFSCFT